MILKRKIAKETLSHNFFMVKNQQTYRNFLASFAVSRETLLASVIPLVVELS